MAALQCTACASDLFVCNGCQQIQCLTADCVNQALSCAGKHELQKFSSSIDSVAGRLTSLAETVRAEAVTGASGATFDSFVSTVKELSAFFPEHEVQFQEMLSVIDFFKPKLEELGIKPSTPLVELIAPKQLLLEPSVGLPHVVRPTDPRTPLETFLSTVGQPWFILTTPLTALNVTLQLLKAWDMQNFQRDWGDIAWYAMVANTIILVMGVFITYTVNNPVQRFLTRTNVPRLIQQIEGELKNNMRRNPFDNRHDLVVREQKILQISFEWTDSTMDISRKIDQSLNWRLVDMFTVSLQVLQNFSTSFSGKPLVEIRYCEIQV